MKKNKLYYIYVLLLIIFCLSPIVWCLIISLTPESEMLKQSSAFLPSEIFTGNYALIFDTSTAEHQATFSSLLNSLKISAYTLLIGLPISTITAYTLARYDFKFKKLYTNILLLTIVIPVFCTIIPIYSMFKSMDLLDSMFWTSVIYVSAFIPLNTWIIMNYIKDLPKELWQAAALDGFTSRQTFFKIILPLSSPIITTSALIMFLMAWKQYVIPIILLSSYDNKPVTMIMSEFMARDFVKYGMVASVGILSIIPPALIAIIFRKFLISGLTSGTVK